LLDYTAKVETKRRGLSTLTAEMAARTGGRGGIPACPGLWRPNEQAYGQQGIGTKPKLKTRRRDVHRRELATMRRLRWPWRTAATGTGVEDDSSNKRRRNHAQTRRKDKAKLETRAMGRGGATAANNFAGELERSWRRREGRQ
jgi:hypothetical protein